MPEYRNILVIQTAFIGDAILASSVLEKLHRFFPSSKLSILVRAGNQHIYEDHPYLHEVITWQKKRRKTRNLFRLLSEVRKRKFDCVINCHRYASSGFIAAFSGARHIAGYKENPFSFLFNFTARHRIGDGTHETERYNQLIADFTDEVTFRPRLYPSPADREKIRTYTVEPFVCIAPASVWFTKQLPIGKWIELCARVPEGQRIFLLGSEADATLCSSIEAGAASGRVKSLAGQLSLLQSCALMEKAEMNYVNDSAPLHLTSAVNAPVTAFFCSTVPEFGFGPLSSRSQVLGVDSLPCRPCGIRGYRACPLSHFRCGHLMPLPETSQPRTNETNPSR